MARSNYNFAKRATYFGLNVDETSSDLEKQYLLGGGSNETAFADCDASIPGEQAIRLSTSGNIVALLSAAVLLYFCIEEEQGTTNVNARDVHCPLLIVGMVIAVAAIINCIVALVSCSRWKYSPTEAQGQLQLAHFVAFWSMVLLIAFAILTLLHWDSQGQPAHHLYHTEEHVGLKHRYVIWGMALIVALALVIAMMGNLALEYTDEDRVFAWTFYMSCTVGLVFSSGMVFLAAAVLRWGELDGKAPAHWSVVGSIIAGGVSFLTGTFGLTISRGSSKSASKLTAVLLALSLSGVATALFSVANAYVAESNTTTATRRTNLLFSGLVGLWGQINTVVALMAAGRWRHYLALPENKRFLS